MTSTTARSTVRYWCASVVLVTVVCVAVTAAQAQQPGPLQKAEAAAKKAAEEKAAAAKAAEEMAATAKAAAEKSTATTAAANKAAAEKVAAEKAAKLAGDEAAEAKKVLAEKDTAAKKATEAAAAAKKAAEQAAAAKTAADKELAKKVAAENVAKQTVVAEQAYHAKMAAEKAAAEKAKAVKALAEKASAANKTAAALAAAEKAAADAQTAKAAAEKAVADKVAAAEAATKVAASEQDPVKKKAAEEAATKATAEKAAAEKTLAEKTTVAKAAADKVLAAKPAADKANAEKATAEKAVPEKAAAVTAALDQAAVAHATALGGLKPMPSSQWDYAKARHLLVRAGFGGTPDEVQKLYELGLHKAVDYMVDIYERPQAHIEFDIMRLERPEPWEGRLEGNERSNLSSRRTSRERRQQAELRRWWLKRMAESPRPLQEKLTLFWHDHLAVQYRSLYRTYILYQQNQLFRTYGCDNYAALLHGIIKDPAMIRYLDNHTNAKGRGNENLGRELQELFSLGEEFSANHMKGGYTEEDVREASRALTGYTYDSWTGQFRFQGTRHDETAKTVLGRKGNWSGNEVVDIILQHPSTAKYTCKKLLVFFAYENPETEVIDTLAHVLRSCGYDMRPMLKNMFLSEVFYSDKSMGSHVKGPAELVIGAIRDLGVQDVNYGSVDSAIIAMGQTLFEPPNVAGWDEGSAWVNAERIFVRYNQVASLVERPNVDVVGLLEGKGLQTPEQIVDFLVKTCMVISPSDAKRKKLASFLGELPPAEQWTAQRNQLNAKLRALVVLLMSMPESQLG